MELGRLAELGTAAEKEERREREHVMQVKNASVLAYNQCCGRGSKYIEFGSGSKI